MRSSALLLALALACRPGDTPDKPDDTDPSGTDTADTSETGWVACEAELQALALLTEGDPPTSAQVQDMLAQVATGCGWPLDAGDDRYLFACDCGGGAWSVAGDFDDWAGQPMESHGALHWVELRVPSPIDVGYKLVKAASYQADPWSRRYLYDEHGELSLVRAQRPHLERWPGFEAEGLRSRTVRVWVPEGGRFDRVLYAHDGQNLFDPQAIWGGWDLQSALPDDILVVANDNTADRMEEYTHVQDRIHGSWYGGEGDTYAAFVHEQLRPWAASHYGPADLHGLLGSSLGGLISLHIAHLYPGEYAFAASMSGTLGWGSIGANHETMIERYAAAGRQSTVIYLDSGGSGTCYDSDGDGIQDDNPSASDNYCETVQMAETLAGLGYQYERDLWHWWEPGASHNEQAWAARVELPLTVFASLD